MHSVLGLNEQTCHLIPLVSLVELDRRVAIDDHLDRRPENPLVLSTGIRGTA